MSWDSYMESLGSYCHNTFEWGGIYSCENAGRWTSKGGGDFQPVEAELKVMINICKHDKSALEQVYINGVHIGGKKYKFIRSDPDEKSITFSTHSDDGKVLNGNAVLTTQAMIVCICKEAEKTPNASNGAAQLATYLKGVGY